MSDSSPIESGEYRLVFEGPVDDSAETLRKLKGVFIADLELSVERVLEVLSQTPATIRSADSEDDLKRYYRALKQAGAKVLIVRPAESEAETTSGSEEEFTFEFNLDGDELTSRPVQDDILSTYAEPDEDLDPSIEGEVDALLQKLETSTYVVEKEAATTAASSQPVGAVNASLPNEPTKSTVIDDAEELFPKELLSKNASQHSSQSLSTLPSQHEDEIITPIEQNVATDSLIELSEESLVIDLSEENERLESSLKAGAPATEETKPLSAKPAMIEVPKTPVVEVLISDAIEEDTEAAHVPVKKKVKKTSNKYGLEVALTLCVSTVLLLGGKGVLWLLEGERNAPAIETATTANKQAAPAEVKPKPEDSPAIDLDFSTITARALNVKHDIRVKLAFSKDTPTYASIRITTPEPEGLTPEQIVRAVAPEPWLRKIEADKLEVILLSPGHFLAKGFAQAFIEDGDYKVRVSSDVTVTGSYDLGSKQLTAHVLAVRDPSGFSSQVDQAIERLSGGSYKFVSRGELSTSDQ